MCRRYPEQLRLTLAAVIDCYNMATTKSKTIADLAQRAAELYGDSAALRSKVPSAWKPQPGWHDLTYRELASAVSELARGLIDLGIGHGDRVAILAQTRVEWTLFDLAVTSIGAVVVPIYATNSPNECEWILSDSQARAVVCEDVKQLAKIDEVRDRLPKLEYALLMEADGAGENANASGSTTADETDESRASKPKAGDHLITISELRDRADQHSESELNDRIAAVKPDDIFRIIYTSGTTGPPKGCVLTHRNGRSVLDMVEDLVAIDHGGVIYLYLPLAHSFGMLVELKAIDAGAIIAYWGGKPDQILPELQEVKPTYLPSVPRLFEKLYALAVSILDPETIKRATQVGLEVRQLENKGAQPDAVLRKEYEEFEERIFKLGRSVFGGELKEAVTGAAPIAAEILEFFYAAGVPVFEGYGMTETTAVSTVSTPSAHKFGSVGRPLPGCEVRIADDGEVLIKGPNVFSGYFRDGDTSFGLLADGWLHTGDVGHVDDDGYLWISGRKKDIIITAGGKNITPANIENDLSQTRWVSFAVLYGDRRPYLVTLVSLDGEQVLPWAREHGLPEDLAQLANEPKVHELIRTELQRINQNYARVEQVKRFAICEHEFSQARGELTPTLKVKRNVIYENYAAVFDRLYSDESAEMSVNSPSKTHTS